MVAYSKHTARWLSPEAMWAHKRAEDEGAERSRFVRPAILRFDHDLFMEELLALLAYKPDRLVEWEARPETWRQPMTSPPTASRLAIVDPISKRSKAVARQTSTDDASAAAITSATEDDALPLKLYQPIQQRHYLVTSSLVCRRKGLPDRLVNPGRQEQAGFVIRRLFTETNPTTEAPVTYEYAYIRKPEGYVWKRLTGGEQDLLQPEEERIPMFTVTYDRTPHPRRILSGVIPVGKRETYLAAGRDDGASAEAGSGMVELPKDSRRLLFDAQVAGPWKAIVEQAAFTQGNLKRGDSLSFPGVDEDDPDVGDKKDVDKAGVLKIAREQAQTASWYILIDLIDFLKTHLKPVWDAVVDADKTSDLRAEEREVYDALDAMRCSFAALDAVSPLRAPDSVDLLDMLKDISEDDDFAGGLESVEVDFNMSDGAVGGWPDYRCALIDPQATPEELEDALPDTAGGGALSLDDPDPLLERITALSDLIEDALLYSESPLVEMSAPTPPFDTKEPWFVIRCVYERPNCGPLNPTVVSAPTAPFQMAAFFDPDAPARPVRIPLPLDISPSGLRKYKKNATFMISDMLCGKIKRIRKLTLGDLVLSVLPWPFHKDLPSVGPTGSCSGSTGKFGMFCSLSIPIVTLCALILLIIIVALFDIFFKWIPYLFFCFPIPGLKGKDK